MIPSSDNQETITGYIQSVVFSNESTQYHIVRVRLDQKKDEHVVVVGQFMLPTKHELCRFIGTFVTHPRFGRQLKLSALEKVMPNDGEGVVRFLSSSLFPKIGPKTALGILEALGPDCLTLIKENPLVVNDLVLTPVQRQNLVAGVQRSERFNEAVSLFVGYGINMKYLIKMDAVYKEQLVPIVRANPYRLIEDIDGIGFQTADRIAKGLGISDDDPRRFKAALVYATSQLCFRTQNTYTDLKSVLRETRRILGVTDFEDYQTYYDQVIADRHLIEEQGRIYPLALYEAEVNIASYLAPYIRHRPNDLHDEVIQHAITALEKELGITYSDEQRTAIVTALTSGISIITGGPGTGKTTVINAIIQLYKLFAPNRSMVLCAPTGRAAKRMTQLTGVDAITIHRFLAWDLDTGLFAIDAENPKEGDLLIVDEFSMVDAHLFHHLLAGTHPFQQIILIGDDHQLPPVAPGDVLADLIAVGSIPTVKLFKIHRQQEGSGIIPLATYVRQGVLDRDHLNCADVTFLPLPSVQVQDAITQLIQQKMELGYTPEDIQVLAPMYDGVAGITHLNEVLRDLMNPPEFDKIEIMSGSTIYREGDKVLQLKNQPDDDVYNGDIGKITEIQKGEGKTFRLTVDFEGTTVHYTDLTNLTHGYCISVHKSQGSEYPIVIFVSVPEHHTMLRRKLIYTGLTRTKDLLYVVGHLDTFRFGIEQPERSHRHTTLQQRIRGDI